MKQVFPILLSPTHRIGLFLVDLLIPSLQLLSPADLLMSVALCLKMGSSSVGGADIGISLSSLIIER